MRRAEAFLNGLSRRSVDGERQRCEHFERPTVSWMRQTQTQGVQVQATGLDPAIEPIAEYGMADL
jgi:hypothetical protein